MANPQDSLRPLGEGPGTSASAGPLAGEGPGVRAGGAGMVFNPYAQVALTYLRRPLSSWPNRLMSAFFICVSITFSLADRDAILKGSAFLQLMLFFSFFLALALHMKGQFVDSRAHLTPGFRRVHATVAAVATLIAAVVLPAGLSWFMGWHSIGFVALVLLLFGTILWVIVNDATWTVFAMLAGWSAFCSTQAGPAWFRELLAGQIEPQALALLVLGMLITLLAGIRLVRLNEEKLTYYSTLRWNWDWSQKTRQGWGGEGRILPGLRDWIREREMTRLARLARRASQSWWSRICRWQMGMVAGWSLAFWIFGTLIYVQALTWWLATISPKPAAAMLAMTSLALAFIPAIIAAMGMLQWRPFKLTHELLLPVERKSYIRQLGTAAALSHFHLWAGMSMALALWWLLVGPRPLQLALLGGVLAFSAAIQVAAFGVLVWVARYRSAARRFFLVMTFFFGAFTAFIGQHVQTRGTLPSKLWITGVLFVLGLLITFDAYRRWLVADFD